MEPIVYLDRSRIRPGRFEEVKRAIDEVVAFIDEREPQLLYYGFHLDEAEQRMTVVAVHPDAASVELHLDVGREAFRGFADLIEMEAMEVYGEPSERMLEQMHDKAQALGAATRIITDPAYAGFSRLAATGVAAGWDDS
ncbi:MAG: hypothetical protein ACLFRD_03055 [Nitriliruptoraceae bacterium]